MEKSTLKISKDNFLPDIVAYIKKGEWKIPRFQREFVWEKKKVIELLDSMYKGFPIGSFFLWIPPEEYAPYYKDIPELNISQDDRKYYPHFILDGQQRLTSLYVVYRGLTVNGFDYSNICFDLDKEADKIAFNSEPSNNERNLSVSLILQDNYHEIYNQLSDKRKVTFMRLREKFAKYPFPVIIIEDKSIEDACKIFERINQGGKRLSIFDLVVAVTWDKDFELKKKIDAFNKEIKDSFGEIDYEVFTETLSLIIKKQCTRAFQIQLTSKDAKDNWNDVIKSIKMSIQFLRSNLKVISYSYLPYRDMLPLIAYYFYNSRDKSIDKKFLELWFWKAALSNRYSGSSFTKIGEDRAYIFDKAINGEKTIINYNINLDIEKIKSINMGRSTALRNALILLMIQEEPLSFLDNSPIDVYKDSISEFNNSEKHHIFPKKYLNSIGIKDKKITDLLVNFCLIDSRLNKEISGKSPKEYFENFKKKNKDIEKALKSHLINNNKDSGIWTNDFKKFIEQRAEILYRLVRSRIGDFTATIEEQMSSNPNQLIQKLEQVIRELINKRLYSAFGENWWNIEKVIPQDIKEYVKQKVKDEKASKPYISNEEWNTPQRLLEQVNIMDYQKIILSNWNLFEDTFGSKEKLQTHFKGFSTIRNQIDHAKTIDPTERKFGETSIEWLFKCVQDEDEKEAIKETEDSSLSKLYVSEIYEELKKRIFELDPKIEEKEREDCKAFYKKETKTTHNFVILRFRQDYIKVRLLIKKNSLKDPSSIVKDLTEGDGELRKVYFDVKSKNEIDYAMTLIKQAYDYNEEIADKKKNKIIENPKRLLRMEFWKQLLDKANEKTKLHLAISPTIYHWIGAGAGKSGISYNYVLVNDKASVEIYFDRGKKYAKPNINKKRFDELIKNKNKIEQDFKSKLEWERLDDKRACRISVGFDIGLNNKERWDELQNKMINTMIKLEKSFREPLKELKD